MRPSQTCQLTPGPHGHFAKHRFPTDQAAEPSFKWWIPWILEDAEALTHPIEYSHPNGAVKFVNLSDDVCQQLNSGISSKSAKSDISEHRRVRISDVKGSREELNQHNLPVSTMTVDTSLGLAATAYVVWGLSAVLLIGRGFYFIATWEGNLTFFLACLATCGVAGTISKLISDRLD